MKHLFFLAALLTPNTVLADGDPARGKRAFLQCVMCHSAVPGGHKSGPSLARIWGRKAATVEGFWKYSEALKQADIVWNAETLNEWLTSPKAMVPGTSMRVPGVKDARDRRDIIAYLKQLAESASARPKNTAQPMTLKQHATKQRLGVTSQ
ncbi:MAG: c-type cytochrome [Rhodospirillales bacterium]